MSFILDALKKSETERQRHGGPSMAEIPYGRPRSSQPLWMVLIVGLLLINLGVLMFWLWRKDPTPAVVIAPQAPAALLPAETPAKPAPAVTAAPPPAPADQSASPAEVRALSTEAYADGPLQAERELNFSEGMTPSDEPKLVRRITGASAAEQAAASASASASGVATLDALGGAGALNLPQLHLDIHVYSAKPAERFVFINMHKYSEGQALSEGPTVERIASDGVVLNYQNRRFLLPRQ